MYIWLVGRASKSNVFMETRPPSPKHDTRPWNILRTFENKVFLKWRKKYNKMILQWRIISTHYQMFKERVKSNAKVDKTLRMRKTGVV